MAGRRHRVAALHEQPYAAHVNAIDTRLQFGHATAELSGVPREHRRRIRTTEMNVVDAELRGILHDLDASAPRVFDEREREQSRLVSRGRHDLDAVSLERLHGVVEVRNGEADVID